MGIFAAKKEIGPDTVLQRKENLLFNQVDGEIVILSVEKSEYYGMGKVASCIFTFLDKPHTFKELIEILLNKYDISESRCVAETHAFLMMLSDKNLIVIQ